MTRGKETAVRDLVEKLCLGGRQWVAVDHWEADRCATGFAHQRDRRRLVYVSTFGMQPGRFHYECEASGRKNPEDYATVSEGDNVTFDELVEVMEGHLDEQRA